MKKIFVKYQLNPDDIEFTKKLDKYVIDGTVINRIENVSIAHMNENTPEIIQNIKKSNTSKVMITFCSKKINDEISLYPTVSMIGFLISIAALFVSTMKSGDNLVMMISIGVMIIILFWSINGFKFHSGKKLRLECFLSILENIE